jgi:acetyltransferase
MTILETFRTRSGLPVRVRYLEPEDAPLLVNIFEHMGDESRYRRFNQSLETPSASRVWAEAEQIAQGVTTNSVGLIAFADLPDAPDTPIGGARFVLLGSGEAEAAISVRDDMQGHGIGTRLMKLLVQEARAAGLERLVGIVQNNNTAVWGLLRHIDAPIEHVADGTLTTIIIHLQDDQE